MDSNIIKSACARSHPAKQGPQQSKGKEARGQKARFTQWFRYGFAYSTQAATRNTQYVTHFLTVKVR